ncbi:MAG: hypothetical protein H6748_20455 [Spirochaetaceae bacterium]|nr:hypothetical protein [Spirochaetaceae bacterium]
MRTHRRKQLAAISTFTLVTSLVVSSSHAATRDVELLRRREPDGRHGALAEAPAHWPLRPRVAEQVLSRAPMRVVRDRSAGRGVTGARRLSLAIADVDAPVDVKWKPAPRLLDTLNNSPRRELAAYQVQRLFLDPTDYVVPTSVLRCLGRDEWRPVRRHVVQTIRGTGCEIGVLSLWLDGVELPDALLDRSRFARDADYAEAIADFNLALYLMKHQDGRRGNFLVSGEEGRPRFFSVDNGVAWSGLLYNWFVPNWKHIRVPALRRASVDRLRTLDRSDLEFLGVVAQLEWRSAQGFTPVDPGPNLDPAQGVRVDGRTIQIGLDAGEISQLAGRIEHLLRDVDRGAIPVFP